MPITILVIFTALGGCITAPGKAPADRLIASNAVILELRETRPAFTALAPDEQSVVYLWLLTNCAVGAENRRTQFVKLGARAEAALIEAFRMGPPTALLSELADTRHGDYAAIKERLDGEDRELFGPELRAHLAAVAEDAYVHEGIDRAITSYRVAALDGISIIGSQTSIAWLERTSPALKEPELSRAMERTLAALRDRSHH